MPSYGEDDVEERLLDTGQPAYPPIRLARSPRPRRKLSFDPTLAVRSLFGVSVLFLLWTIFFYDQAKAARLPRREFAMPVSVREVLVSSTPQEKFRDNLQEGRQYITGLHDGSFEHQVLSAIHTIYMSLLLKHTTAVIPSFELHVQDAPHLRFGDLFDLARFQRATNLSVVDWSDLKSTSSAVEERLACHSITNVLDGSPWSGFSYALRPHKVNVSYYPLEHGGPDLVKPTASGHKLYFDDLAVWYGEKGKRTASDAAALEADSSLAPVDDHFLCLDRVVGLQSRSTSTEPTAPTVDLDYPTWHHVGRHLHFGDYWHRLAEGYLRRTLGLAKGKPLPIFIAVRGSFDVLNDAVHRVRESLKLSSARVIVTNVEHMHDRSLPHDWLPLDHESLDTRERDGAWAPIIIDRVVESLASGFVGERESDRLSSLRVRDWQKGHAELVIAR